MQKFIKWLIKMFLPDLILIKNTDYINLNSRLNTSSIRVNQLINRIHNQSDVIRHLETVIDQHNQPQTDGGLLNQIQDQSSNEIYKNFGNRLNTIRVIKSPTKNCQWISIYNSQSLIGNDDSLKLIEEFTKYGKKKMVLVDVQRSVIKDIKIIFMKTHDIHFATNYKNSNGSLMTIIMFKLKDEYYRKWLDVNNNWTTFDIENIYSRFNIPEIQRHIDDISRKVGKSGSLSWKAQTQGLSFSSNESINKLPNKYEKQINETQENFDLRMRKLKQQEHQQRMRGSRPIFNNINNF